VVSDNGYLKPNPDDADDVIEYLNQLEDWFVGFEKDLRDKLVYAEKTRKAWRGKSQHRIDEEIAREWDGIIIAIKEILGE
jgi:hypothetical protein